MKWLSTREFAQLIEDHFPANEQKVREWCESGDIPPYYAKRDPSKRRTKAQWLIKSKGIEVFLKEGLKLADWEVEAIVQKLNALAQF